LVALLPPSPRSGDEMKKQKRFVNTRKRKWSCSVCFHTYQSVHG
jgi:hypothetical protein